MIQGRKLRVHDRLCASLGGLKRVGAVAADGGATRSLLVE